MDIVYPQKRNGSMPAEQTPSLYIVLGKVLARVMPTTIAMKGELHQWGDMLPTNGDCLTCMGMYVNGAGIGKAHTALVRKAIHSDLQWGGTV